MSNGIQLRFSVILSQCAHWRENLLSRRRLHHKGISFGHHTT